MGNATAVADGQGLEGPGVQAAPMEYGAVGPRKQGYRVPKEILQSVSCAVDVDPNDHDIYRPFLMQDPWRREHRS